MEDGRTLQITNLQERISILQQEEERLKSIVSSTLTTPEFREQAQIGLGVVARMIEQSARELSHLERGL